MQTRGALHLDKMHSIIVKTFNKAILGTQKQV